MLSEEEFWSKDLHQENFFRKKIEIIASGKIKTNDCYRIILKEYGSYSTSGLMCKRRNIPIYSILKLT